MNFLRTLFPKNCSSRAAFTACFQPTGSVTTWNSTRTNRARRVLTTFHFLRQQIEKTDGTPNWCLADFVAPKHSTFSIQHSTSKDYLGAFAVTSGHGLKELVEKFKADHDDYNAIMAEALADRLAEAFAEFLHKHVREEWGYGRKEQLANDDLIAEKYRGIRPAAGYPACPDHTEKQILWKLLDVEKSAGIQLTESCAMWPGSSVSGLYFAHPESKYFAVGKLGRDQMIDYHLRKGMTLQEVERWLGPWLNYEPQSAGAGITGTLRLRCSALIKGPKNARRRTGFRLQNHQIRQRKSMATEAQSVKLVPVDADLFEAVGYVSQNEAAVHQIPEFAPAGLR